MIIFFQVNSISTPGKTYYVDVCRAVQGPNIPTQCSSAAVCSQNKASNTVVKYGAPKNMQFVNEGTTIKMMYTGGTKCPKAGKCAIIISTLFDVFFMLNYYKNYLL